MGYDISISVHDDEDEGIIQGSACTTSADEL